MIERDLVLCDVSAQSWQEVVKLGGSLLEKNDYIDTQFTQSMIDTVMRLGPYMILLPQIAFFHGEPSEHVKKVGMSLVVLNESVYFEEFDNQEIKCAFSFCAVDSDSHLEMLQKFAELLANDKLIDLLRNNGRKEDILKLIKESENENVI
ncbi:PTS sugar transporter subunit IIA [Erysipelothrix aquatica]|uniref:PTS sugar transporter subunit IIA n=1 Tax=Erysipelothrix aquatica TaxID=2683714 RepID=UPI001358D44C|nr:PTS sugar transporter subunit IIA [Erysipelothrix aquatica]